MRKAIIFDFDGLIIETELVELKAWQETFKSYGQELEPDYLDAAIGTGDHIIDPISHLEKKVGTKVNREQVRLRKARLAMQLGSTLKPLPGVLELLDQARSAGIKLAIASNSSQTWIFMHLHRLDLFPYFEVVATRNEVAHSKPDPALYNLALEKLSLGADQAVAIEDSPHGIAAACAAGLPVLAVPSTRTVGFDFSAASAVVSSLQEISLKKILSM